MPTQRPLLAGIVHVALTVTNVERSVEWYMSVLGLETVTTEPHSGGYGVVLRTPDERVWFALHHHDANQQEPFDETRTGLDHVAFWVDSQGGLEEWRTWLDDHDVPRGEVMEFTDLGVAAMTFRDPDNTQLELVSPLRGE